MKIRPIICLLAALLFSQSIKAADFGGGRMAIDFSSFEDNSSALYGQACEKIKQGELKSSVRMRATDKASYSAVKSLNGLSDFEKKVNEHDFNVMVYNIVDNYVEDLAVRTTKQNNQEICVEITGYVNKNDIRVAIEDVLDEKEKQQIITNSNELREDEKKTVAETAPKTEAKIEPAPAPNPNGINFETTVSPAISERQEQPQVMTAAQPLYAPEPTPAAQPTYTPPQSISPSAQAAPAAPAPIAAADDKRELVYIAPTEFFNNTTSTAHTGILQRLFDKNDYFYLTDKKELADYVITSKVLRAKVDPINDNTNRLQMVVAVGVDFVDDNSSTIEHQNRFILFSSEDDEQQVAAKLMSKLFGKAGETILVKVESEARRKNRAIEKPMLTPGTPSR